MNRSKLQLKIGIVLLLFIMMGLINLYGCTTGREIERYHIGMGISYTMEEYGSGKKVILAIKYESDVPFPLEIGLLKNFIPASFSVVQGNDTVQDTCFQLKLNETKGALVTQQLELHLDECSNQDDLILWFANRKAIPKHDPNGYHFLRLNSGNKANLPVASSIQWERTTRDPNLLFSLYPTSVTQLSDGLSVDFVFSPEILYDGRQELTRENPDLMVDFLLLALDSENLMPFKTSNYLKGSVPVKEDIHFHVELNWKGKHGDSLSFFLIPFPCLDYNNSERLQKVIYNSSTHFTISI